MRMEKTGGVSDKSLTCRAPDADLAAGIAAEFNSGCEMYLEKCSTCHMLDGDTTSNSLDLNQNPLIPITQDIAVNDIDCVNCLQHETLASRIAQDMPPEPSEPVSLADAKKIATYIRASFFEDFDSTDDRNELPQSLKICGDYTGNAQLGCEIYMLGGAKSCVGCHGVDGSGTDGDISTIGLSDWPIGVTYLNPQTSYDGLVNKIQLNMPSADNPLTAPDSDNVAIFILEAFGTGNSSINQSIESYSLSHSW